MKKTFFITILYYFGFSCCFTIALKSQQPTQEWVARYERPSGSSGIANKMALDKVGNCYVLGNTNANGGEIVLIKYNLSGDTVWTRKYQGSATVALISDSLGNVYVTGYVGPTFGPYDIITIKYNPQGVQQWIKTYDNGGNEESRDIAMDNAGNIYVNGIAGNESLVIKYNSEGDTIWTRKYTEPGFRFPSLTITLDKYQNVYIGGGKINISLGTQNYYTLKYDSAGVFKWAASYSLGGVSALSKVKVDQNLNVYVTGRSNISKMLTIKYDSAGAEQWQRIYDGPGSGGELASDMVIDNLGNIIITGASSGTGTGSFDYLTIKYNSKGDSLWVKRYNGTGNGNDEAYSLELDDSNNVYITGRSIGNFTGWDYVTIKYNSLGIQQWLERFPSKSNNNSIAYVIALDRFQNVYVTGKRDSSGFDSYTTIKYSQPVTAIEPISNNIPDTYRLHQNYPNPFNPVTNIKFEILKSSQTELKVYDVLGREVLILIQENLKAGKYEISFNASTLSSGIYFYKIVTKEYAETKKMIVVK